VKLLTSLSEVQATVWLERKHLEMPLDLIFYLCPKREGDYLVNSFRTGLTTQYGIGISPASQEGLAKARQALPRIKERVAVGSVTAVFAAADAIIIPTILLPEPQMGRDATLEITQVADRVVSNYDTVLLNLFRWGELYRSCPWKGGSPEWAVERQTIVHRRILPRKIPQNLVDDFVHRCFTGYSLDGESVREGEFGLLPNPVILGVEAPGLALLQSASLEEDNRVSIIQLH